MQLASADSHVTLSSSAIKADNPVFSGATDGNEQQPPTSSSKVCEEVETVATSNKLSYRLLDRPPAAISIFLGLQHFLTSFGATLAIPLFLSDAFKSVDPSFSPVDEANLISTVIFTAGVCTLVQTTIGTRLPIIQGGSFSFLTPAISVITDPDLYDEGDGWRARMQMIQGGLVGAAAFQIAVGATGLSSSMLRYVGPLTLAPTVALVGLSLYPAGAPMAGGNWGVGGFAIGAVILFSQLLPHKHKIFRLFPVLLAIVSSWAFAGLLTASGALAEGNPGRVDGDTAVLSDSAWIRVPYPGQWGAPRFTAAAVFGMLAGTLTSIFESIGDYHACAALCDEAPIPHSSINRGIATEGVCCVLAGLVGTGNGSTSYSENISTIGVTGVASRSVVQVAAVVMIVLGLVPKFGAVFTLMPQPIVGALYCTMFGMIASVGLSLLENVDLKLNRNQFILGFALFMGLSLPEYFKQKQIEYGTEPFPDVGNTQLSSIIRSFFGTGMTVGCMCGLLLDNLIPGTAEQRGCVPSQQPTAENTAHSKQVYAMHWDFLEKCCAFVPSFRNELHEEQHVDTEPPATEHNNNQRMEMEVQHSAKTDGVPTM